jgi:hypothetical protein
VTTKITCGDTRRPGIAAMKLNVDQASVRGSSRRAALQ